MNQNVATRLLEMVFLTDLLGIAERIRVYNTRNPLYN